MISESPAHVVISKKVDLVFQLDIVKHDVLYLYSVLNKQRCGSKQVL